MITYLKLLAAVLAWGGTFVAAKFAVLDASAEINALARFVLASLLLLAIVRFQYARLPRLNSRQLFYVLLLGLSGVTLYNLFFFSGLKTVEAGRGALIITSNPVWIALGSAWLFRQRFDSLNLLGFLLCVTGVTIVITRGQPSSLLQGEIGGGELALLGCTLAWAAYTLIGKKQMNSPLQLPPLVLVTYSCVAGSAILLAWNLWSGQAITATVSVSWVLSVLYLSVLGTVAAFIWYFQAVRDIGAAQASAFIFLVPVSAIVFGTLLFHEPLTQSLLTGSVLIMGGVALVNRAPGPIRQN